MGFSIASEIGAFRLFVLLAVHVPGVLVSKGAYTEKMYDQC